MIFLITVLRLYSGLQALNYSHMRRSGFGPGVKIYFSAVLLCFTDQEVTEKSIKIVGLMVSIFQSGNQQHFNAKKRSSLFKELPFFSAISLAHDVYAVHILGARDDSLSISQLWGCHSTIRLYKQSQHPQIIVDMVTYIGIVAL